MIDYYKQQRADSHQVNKYTGCTIACVILHM